MHKDRFFHQIPACLPDWLDGPTVRAKAQEWGISEEEARERLKAEAQHDND